jgi:hypothetical protein
MNETPVVKLRRPRQGVARLSHVKNLSERAGARPLRVAETQRREEPSEQRTLAPRFSEVVAATSAKLPRKKAFVKRILRPDSVLI